MTHSLPGTRSGGVAKAGIDSRAGAGYFTMKGADDDGY